MNTKKLWPIVVIAAVVIIGVLVYQTKRPGDTPGLPNGLGTSTPSTGTPSTGKDHLIQVTSPQSNKAVNSPFVIEGKARGTWFFEGSFPLKIVDLAGNVVTTTYATAQGEWMTEDFVDFKTQVVFAVTTTTSATLILEKDNPSGLPEHANSVSVPITLLP